MSTNQLHIHTHGGDTSTIYMPVSISMASSVRGRPGGNATMRPGVRLYLIGWLVSSFSMVLKIALTRGSGAPSSTTNLYAVARSSMSTFMSPRSDWTTERPQREKGTLDPSAAGRSAPGAQGLRRKMT